MRAAPIVALEIGTTKVRTLIGEAREDGHIMVTGLGECASRGVRKSEIVDFENALLCVKSSLKMAEENSHVMINQIHLLVSGGHIRSLVHRGSVPVLHDSREIRKEDIEHSMETARAVNLSANREILHTICQQFLIDDHEDGVINPEGMEGSQLAVDMLILHGVRNRLRNTVKIVRSVPMDIQDVAFSGLCAALGVLGPEQKERGVGVIDLGGGSTDYIVYAGNAIAAAGSIAVGGDHVTNDIARGLHVSTSEAEKLKEEWGSALPVPATRTQQIPLASNSNKPSKFVKRMDLDTIIHSRLEELLTIIKHRWEQDRLLNVLGTGIVITGGGAFTRNMEELVEKVFELPCSIGQPKNVSGLAAATESPDYAAPVGMLRYGVRTAQRESPLVAIRSIFKSLFRW